MAETEQVEKFYKDDFCKAVTGRTDSELRDLIREDYVRPMDEALNLSIGRDMPRSEGDEVVASFEIFMGTQFKIRLLDKPVVELYDSFRKFRTFERHIHPRNQFPAHEEYWGPTYTRAEEAYARRDEAGFKDAVMDLVDKIIHD